MWERLLNHICVVCFRPVGKNTSSNLIVTPTQRPPGTKDELTISENVPDGGLGGCGQVFNDGVLFWTTPFPGSP